MSFVHLHVHSVYSLLDGYSKLDKLMTRAKEMNMPAVALTDHGTMFGVIDFYNAATRAGIKPLIGVESYMAARRMQDRDSRLDKKSTHLLLLAENETGYKNLLRIASASQLEGFYYYPRVDHEFLAAHAEGLICTSGCMAAEIPRLLLDGKMEEARRKLDWYYEVFAPDRFFLELQEHAIPEIASLNKALLDLGKRYRANYVATNDVHYVDPADARLQDILLAIQTGSVLDDPKRMRMSDPSYYLRSPEEMIRLFGHIPGAIENTLAIAERCQLDLTSKEYHLPEFEVPPGYTPETYLSELCEEGLRWRYGEAAQSEAIRARLDYELSVIHQMGFEAYFLIVWDLCRFARTEGVWYNARGSAAGSIVAYTLNITLVDPIAHGLIFERFLNPGRISMPDIDLDFRDDMRARMMEYCALKYGHDKVAQIITFGTLKARAAVRDVGRVMGVALSDVDRVAKLIPAIPGRPVSIAEAIEEVPDLKKIYNTEAQIRELLDTAKDMEGVVRSAGTHAAGVVVTDKPIIEYVPLHRPTSNGAEEDLPIKSVTQFEMAVLDSLGLLKVDFLGLVTLTVMARACDFIEERYGRTYTLDTIPIDDPLSFELLGRGDTAGVFQVEGQGIRRYLVEMKPKNLGHVVAMIALYRPGPLEFIPSYIRRMHGEEPISYLHPALAPIFEETYGIPVYQEQLMRAAVELAGYTASEADDLRKAISKKIKEKLMKHRDQFVEGTSKTGIPPETAHAIFDNWEEFARYGFNKCLPGDVEILDASTGKLVKVEDLYRGVAKLSETVTCEIESLRLKSGYISKVMDNGVKPVYRLTTALGRQIEATGNHPFYAFSGWQNLEDLKTSDLIAIPRYIPVEGKNEWPEHEVIALGHLLAEGNLCHPHSVYFYSQDDDQVSDFVHAAETFDNAKCTVAMHKSTWSVYVSRTARKIEPGIVPWAKELGIWGKNAREKTIPDEVFTLTNRQIGLLISRMWQGDGHIDKASRAIFYATASEKMARQLQHLLLRFGIISRLRTVTFPYKEGRVGYQLFVTANENLRAFDENIGCYFLNGRRKQALENILQLHPGRVIGTKDIVPMPVKDLIREAKEQNSTTWIEMNAVAGIAQREFYPSHTATKRGFTRETIGRLANYFGDSRLQRYADNDIYWDEIIDIEYVGEKQTYDLEIPEAHNFIANDILVHNSHAADYGVIAVETAYLKAHYPVEYMTALLSASKNDTDKVALYAADSRRMGIQVLPPDIGTSGWDFTIEDRPTETGPKAAIRFGLGAVKNVGQGPVEAILQARASKPFEDLNDLARRVDLRAVGKRALEALARVGALDSFAPRPALLEGLDRILSASATHFKAADVGQLSLFGAGTGVTHKINLPKATQPLSRREMLQWERDLLGLYVSDHPLSPYMDTLDNPLANITPSAELPGLPAGQKIRVAGLLIRFRPHTTKAGKAMAFATMQDIQGNIELVIFPNTWNTVKPLIAVDNVLLVEGSLDADGKILVDSVTTEFKSLTALEEPLPPENRGGISRGASPRAPTSRPAPPPRAQPAAPAPQFASPPRDPDLPLDPFEDFPDDWDVAPPEFIDTAEIGSEAERPAAPVPPAKPGPAPLVAEPAPVAAAPPAAAKPGPAPLVARPLARALAEPAPTPILPLSEPAPEDGLPRRLVVIQRSNGDKARDSFKTKRVFNILISYPGPDRFAFYVFEGSKSYLLEFPNLTTGICDELLTRLSEVVGGENLRVEPIIYQ